jgi:uncharacterized membrane protein YbhN (UPF0104 family)
VNKQLVVNLLKYLLAIALLALVIRMNWAGEYGLGAVWHRHVEEGHPVAWGFFAIAFTVYAVAAVITMLRWYLLVRAQDLPFSVPQALRLGMVGCFFNAFLPGSVGGDIIKAAALARSQSRRTVAVATVIMDRVIALWGLIWFVALLGGVFWLAGALEGAEAFKCKVIVGTAAVTVVVSLTVWLLMGLLPQRRAERFALRLGCLPRVGASAAEMWRAVWMYRCRQMVVYQVLALSWVGHVGFVVAFYCAANTLWDGTPPNAVPTFVQHFLLVPIGLVVQAVIPLPGGIGIGELGFGTLYELLGGSKANGILGSLVQRVVAWIFGLIGWGVYANLKAHQPTLATPKSDRTPDEIEVPAEAPLQGLRETA